jgi:DNA-binding transcriptional MerR regulator
VVASGTSTVAAGSVNLLTPIRAHKAEPHGDRRIHLLTMHIGNVAQMTGASPKAIRHYEALGLIPQVQRRGAYRTYTVREVNLIRLIRAAQALGFKLSELLSLTEGGQRLSWQGILGLIEHKHASVLRELARLDHVRGQLEAVRRELQGCLDPEGNEVDLTDIDCDFHVSPPSPLRE